MTTPSFSAPSPEDMLGGSSGVATFKFPMDMPGTSLTGEVVSTETVQQREFSKSGPGNLLFWDDGKPRWQVVLTVVNKADGDQYRVFLKGQLLAATKAAIAKAGDTSLTPGGTVTITFTGMETNAKTGYDSKHYTVEYTKPVPGAKTADILAVQDAPAPKAAPVAEAPAPAAPAPTVDQLSAEALATLKANNLI